MYSDREKIISTSHSPIDVEEIERWVDTKVDEKIQSLQKVITNLSTENLDLRNNLKKTTEEIQSMKTDLEDFKQYIKEPYDRIIELFEELGEEGLKAFHEMIAEHRLERIHREQAEEEKGMKLV